MAISTWYLILVHPIHSARNHKIHSFLWDLLRCLTRFYSHCSFQSTFFTTRQLILLCSIPSRVGSMFISLCVIVIFYLLLCPLQLFTMIEQLAKSDFSWFSFCSPSCLLSSSPSTRLFFWRGGILQLFRIKGKCIIKNKMPIGKYNYTFQILKGEAGERKTAQQVK